VAGQSYQIPNAIFQHRVNRVPQSFHFSLFIFSFSLLFGFTQVYTFRGVILLNVLIFNALTVRKGPKCETQVRGYTLLTPCKQISH